MVVSTLVQLIPSVLLKITLDASIPGAVLPTAIQYEPLYATPLHEPSISPDVVSHTLAIGSVVVNIVDLLGIPLYPPATHLELPSVAIHLPMLLKYSLDASIRPHVYALSFDVSIEPPAFPLSLPTATHTLFIYAMP